MEAELFGEESSAEEDESSEESDSEAAGEEQVGCVHEFNVFSLTTGMRRVCEF